MHGASKIMDTLETYHGSKEYDEGMSEKIFERQCGTPFKTCGLVGGLFTPSLVFSSFDVPVAS
jgi:hypothetical protein